MRPVLRWWLVLLAVAAGCSESPPNVLLIAVDTLRADHLGAYGYARPTSKALDRFFAESVVFDDVQGSSAWTLPSFATLLTSLDPAAHRTIGPASRLADAHTTLPEALQAEGYRTAAFVSHHFLASRYGLAQGIAEYDETLVFDLEESHRAISSPAITERAIAWLDATARRTDARPWFLWLHYFDPHHDYLAHPEVTEQFGDSLIDRYDGEIAFTDEHIGRVLAALDSQELADDTVVVFVTDHGEEFGEHGRIGHGRSLHSEVTRLALAIRAPGLRPRRVEQPVHAVDLVPTVLDLLGIDSDGPFTGRSLVPSMSHGASLEPRARIAQASLYRDSVWSSYRFLGHVLFERHSPGVAPERRLYDLATDPDEQRDVSEQRPEIVAEYARGLRESLEAARTLGLRLRADEAERRVELDARDLERLRDLGYVE